MSKEYLYRILITLDRINFKRVMCIIEQGVMYTEYEFTNKIVKVRCLGIYVEKAGLQQFTKKKIKAHYFYDLYFFRDKETMQDYYTNAPTKANIILNKYVKRDIEPYVLNVERPSDMFVIAPHELNTTYKGYFCRIDMHSAEPYFLSKELPELKEQIQELYDKRRVSPECKKTLVCLNGICRNIYISVYMNVVNKLYAKMEETVDLLQSKGLYPFYIARDGLIVRADTKKELEAMREYMDIGEDLGQWDMSDIEYGKVTTTHTPINFISNLSFQKSIQIGKPLECDIMHIQPLFDEISGIKYIVHDNANWRVKDINDIELNFWE